MAIKENISLQISETMQRIKLKKFATISYYKAKMIY